MIPTLKRKELSELEKAPWRTEELKNTTNPFKKPIEMKYETSLQ